MCGISGRVFSSWASVCSICLPLPGDVGDFEGCLFQFWARSVGPALAHHQPRSARSVIAGYYLCGADCFRCQVRLGYGLRRQHIQSRHGIMVQTGKQHGPSANHFRLNRCSRADFARTSRLRSTQVGANWPQTGCPRGVKNFSVELSYKAVRSSGGPWAAASGELARRHGGETCSRLARAAGVLEMQRQRIGVVILYEKSISRLHLIFLTIDHRDFLSLARDLPLLHASQIGVPPSMFF